MRKFLYSLFVISFVAVLAGCNPYNNEGEGAAAGGAAGMLVGGIIGHQSHDTGAGMLIGGAVGAVTGAAVGSQIQKPVVEEPAPVVVAQPAAVVPTTTYNGDTVTINVPNSSGGYTSVVLKRSGSGYVGPQGEYYDQIPSVEQLQAMYGR
jgi:Glycine zipper/Prokaryotic membrane lipoprotein lipid attachment site